MKSMKMLWLFISIIISFVFIGCGNHNYSTVEPVATPVTPTYTSFPIEHGAHALTNDGKGLVYGTVDGLMYRLDIKTDESTFLYDLNNNIPNLLIGGLAYISGTKYYYGAAHNASIRLLDISTGESWLIAENIFPDGIDYYRGKIYTVTDDRDQRLTVMDTNGNVIDRLPTGIDDFVAIAHTDKYLYILSEDGDVYQTNPDTGESKLVIDNSGFEEGDSFGGVEGIDVFQNHIYLSNVNDSTIYRVDLDIRSIE